MPTYSVNVDLKGIAPVPRHFCLDELMEASVLFHGGQGCRPKIKLRATAFRTGSAPGIPSDIADSLKQVIEGRIKSEVQGGVDVTVSKVRIRNNWRLNPRVSASIIDEAKYLYGKWALCVCRYWLIATVVQRGYATTLGLVLCLGWLTSKL